MITIFSYPQTDCGFIKTGDTEFEYSCPHCFKPIKWAAGKTMSPANCLGCAEKLMDLTKIIGDDRWRVAYHQAGEVAVQCGSLLQS